MGLFRLFLAICVVVGHSGPFMGIKLLSGPMAVESFFIISGFYMALILNEKYKSKRNKYKLFITNRFLRIYPIYWITLIVTITASIVFKINGHANIISFYNEYLHFNLSSLFLGISNLFIFGQGTAQLLALDNTTGNLFFTTHASLLELPLSAFIAIPQAWSLEFELLFYLAAPLLVNLSKKLLIFLIMIFIAIRFYLYTHGFFYDPWTFRFFPLELVFFLAGITSYEFYKSLFFLKHYKTLFPVFLSLCFISVFIYLGGKSPYFYSFDLSQWFFYFLLIPTIPLLFNYFKNSSLDNFIGEFSYPVYLLHIVIIDILIFLQLRTDSTKFYFSFLVTIITIACSYICIKLVINPIDRYRQKRIVIRKRQ